MTVIVKHPFVSTVPDSTDTSLVRPSNWNADHTITGLGTAAELNAGSANGVATLDSSGKVPISQIPDSVIGALSYQGTWNASTNTPTLTSSVGTKGYYYVVSVAGTTNLNGITDWQIGDWAVYNGTAWQKIDNTDAVTSVNGYTGTVVLTQPDIAGTANAPTNTNITSMTGITGGISTADFVTFDTTYATTLTAGQLGWDGNNTLALGMAGGNVIQHIGEDSFFYIKASSAITKGQLVMFTGAVGASGVLTGAPSTGVTNPQYIMGVAAENIALNGFGLIQWFGEITGVNTNAFNEGDILYYDSSVTGGLTNTYPTSGIIVTVAAVAKKSAGGGVLYVRVSVTDRITASTGISVSQNGTGTSITNTAPDQTVAIASGTGISVTGTYPNFTVTNTSPSSGGTVTSITAGTGLSGGTITTSGTIALADTTVSAGSYTNTSITVDAQGRLTSASSGTAPVTSVTGTSPVASSGGATPAISLSSGYGDTQNPYASKTANYFLAAPDGSAGAPTFRAVVAADIPTLNQNTTGSAGSVANAVTFTNTGGAAAGTTFNGSAAKTIDYSTVGAPKADGTGASGTWGISVTGNAGTVTNGVYTSGSYADPTWITSLAGSKITGTISGGTF